MAQISINRSVIEFSDTSKIQDIEITNRGQDKLYLDLKIAEIINPELEKPTRVSLSDPRTASILVNPRQVLLAPGQRKVVRIILREAAIQTDRIYRLKVSPYTGKIRMNGEQSSSTKATGIKILTGYDLLLISRPENLVPQVVVSRSDESIEFSNVGNTSVLLSKIEQCHSTGKNCTELRPNRLYAGETYRVNLPNKGDPSEFPVKVTQNIAQKGIVESY